MNEEDTFKALKKYSQEQIIKLFEDGIELPNPEITGWSFFEIVMAKTDYEFEILHKKLSIK